MQQILTRAYRTIGNVLNVAIAPFFNFSDVIKPSLNVAVVQNENEKGELCAIAAQKETNSYSIRSVCSDAGKARIFDDTITVAGAATYTVTRTMSHRSILKAFSIRNGTSSGVTSTGIIELIKQNTGGTAVTVMYVNVGNNYSFPLNNYVLEAGDQFQYSDVLSAGNAGTRLARLLVMEID